MIWSCVANTVELGQKAEDVWFKWKYDKDRKCLKIEQKI